MIGSFATAISTGTSIDAAPAVIRHGSSKKYAHSHGNPEDVTLHFILGLMGVFMGALAILMLVFYGGDSFQPRTGTVNPEAIERARQRDLPNQPPPPVFLYSQKVPTKILYVGSYKHVRANVRNQVTGTEDSVYLCKKYCGSRHGGPKPGSVLDITWRSYRDAKGIFQRADRDELYSLYK